MSDHDKLIADIRKRIQQLDAKLGATLRAILKDLAASEKMKRPEFNAAMKTALETLNQDSLAFNNDVKSLMKKYGDLCAQPDVKKQIDQTFDKMTSVKIGKKAKVKFKIVNAKGRPPQIETDCKFLKKDVLDGKYPTSEDGKAEKGKVKPAAEVKVKF